MKIKKGDYTFCGEDTRPHRWALKINDTLVQLYRKTFEEFCASTPDVDKHEPGQPTMYYVSADGGFATLYPPADKDYELVQLTDKEQ